MSKTVSTRGERINRFQDRVLQAEQLKCIGGTGLPEPGQMGILLMGAFLGGAGDEPADGPP